MKSVTTATLFLAAILLVTSGDIISPAFKIPANIPGFDYKPTNPSPTNVYEIFCCSLDSRCIRGWTMAKDVQNHFTPTSLKLLYHELPFPNYRNSLFVSSAYLAMQEMKADGLFTYMEFLMTQSHWLSNDATYNMSELQVKDLLADMAKNVTGVDKNSFLDKMKVTQADAYQLWKYSVSRSVTYSPTYFVNGVDVVVGQDEPTLSEWVRLVGTVFP